jgi:hypothetical protein
MGPNTFVISCTDPSGNTQTATVSYTRNAVVVEPTTTIADPLPAAPTLTPQFNVSSDNPSATFECSVNDSAFAACDPAAGTYADSFNDAATNKLRVRATVSGVPDATPETTYIWTDTADPTADATIVPSTTAAGAHPDIDSTIVLHGGYNPKSVTINMPLGFNGALTATDERCTMDDAYQGLCGVNAPGSLIGTLTGDGVSVRDGYLTGVTGNLYITESPNPDTPAGVALDMESPNGLGFIRAVGEVHITQTPNGDVNGEVRQQIVIPSIPQRTDLDNRFHANRVELHLQGDPAGGTYPLLTNPTTCPDTPAQFTGSGTTYGTDGDDGSDGPPVADVAVEYPVSDCASLEFDPQLTQEFFMPDPVDGSTYDANDPAPSLANVGSALTSNRTGYRKGQAGTLANLDLGAPSQTARRAGVASTVVYMPTSIGANLPAFGDQQVDACPGGAADYTTIFDPSACPASAKIGTIAIDTPLLADPLIGNVYAINKTPIPWIGIDINPLTGPNNPAGVSMRLTGLTNTTPYPGCSTTGAPWCGNRVQITLSHLPDVPMTHVKLDMSGRTARPPAPSTGNPLPSLPLITADGGDAGCKPDDQIISEITPGAIELSQLTRTQDTTMSYCVPPDLSTISWKYTNAATGVVSGANPSTTNPNVTLTWTSTEPGGVQQCRFNGAAWISCASPYTATNLPNGLNQVEVRVINAAGDDENRRSVSFTVDAVAPPQPTLTRQTAGSNATQAWSFTRGTATPPNTTAGTMQCQRDATAWQTSTAGAACGGSLSGTSGALNTTGWATGVSHTFSLRNYDAVGNISTLASVTWAN